jgi:hypothetical protein
MKEVNSDSTPRVLKPQSTVVEVVVGVALLIGSIALAREAAMQFQAGKQFSVIEDVGLAIGVLGGCLDPINFVWICLPFTKNHVATSPQFAKIGWAVSGIGFLFFIIGLIGKHWLP